MEECRSCVKVPFHPLMRNKIFTNEGSPDIKMRRMLHRTNELWQLSLPIDEPKEPLAIARQ